MNLVDTAMMLALKAHAGDYNKHDGEPYVLHLARVWVLVRNAGGTHCQQAIAWLHDSVEDEKITLHDVYEAFNTLGVQGHDRNRIVNGVDAMTKRKGESNENYYRRVKMNDDARFVKLRGDIVDNFSRNHNITDEATKVRMASKYSLGIDILK